MEPPFKRPCLSMFRRRATGAELDAARHSNDNTLKSRFESIFEKYTQDFTGIGDEVDLLSGQVIVNNGHLESIETETDPGIEHLAGDFLSTGRSMLRAMAVTLNPDLPGPDDVLMSIETIAQNAALDGDDTSSNESTDNLFETSRASSDSVLNTPSDDTAVDELDASIEPYNSDNDSLFEEEKRLRASSIDSLFIPDDNQDQDEIWAISQQASSTEPIPRALDNANDDEAIMARFGPYVGKEVINMIGQRQEAHIEPAWRIPVNLGNKLPRRTTPVYASSLPAPESPAGKRSRSLWKLPKPTKQFSPIMVDSVQQAREESVDPLQEDSDRESEPSAKIRSEPRRAGSDLNSDADADSEFEPDDRSSPSIHVQDFTSGDCPYCHIGFGNKSGLMAHWDRLIRHWHKRIRGDDPHDLDTMKKIRATAIVRIRYPRLVVYDFRTMVELHEGAGLGFDEIAVSKTLRTHKSGLQLQDIYNKHRTPPGCQDTRVGATPWTEQEEQSLRKMCENPLATMSTLRRGLKARGELEIGNHLADLWLSQLSTIETTDADYQNTMSTQSISQPALPYYHNERTVPVSLGQQLDSAAVKREHSEDELFVR